MKTNISTTREQSDRLLQCGVPDESADMCYQFIDDCVNNTDKPICNTPKEQYNTLIGYGFGDSRIHITPAFSLSALLGLLPTSILGPTGNEYMLELSKLRMHCAWEVQWWNGRSRFTTYDKKKKFHKLWDKSPIEACVKAIEWLTERGYKLNAIEKGGEV